MQVCPCTRGIPLNKKGVSSVSAESWGRKTCTDGAGNNRSSVRSMRTKTGYYQDLGTASTRGMAQCHWDFQLITLLPSSQGRG